MLSNANFQRIFSNYLRMGLGFVLGILLVRLLLQFGENVFAAVVLTASSIGIAEILKETIRGATVPELGRAYHSGDRERFERAYASSLVLSLLAALFGVVVLGLFILFLGSFNLDPALRAATAFFIATRMLSLFLAITLSPVMNMMPIRGRMLAYNFWLSMERIAEVGAALVVSILLTNGDGSSILRWFGLSSMVAMSATTLAASLHAMKGEGRLLPDFTKVSAEQFRSVASSVGWNSAAVGSVNLYLRFDMFAVNILYGLAGTVVFGLAGQLAAYTRNITMGLITGLDAVVSRHSAVASESARKLVTEYNQRTFELQCLSLTAIGIVLVLHAQFVIQFLFGDRLSDPQGQIPDIAFSFLFLMFGMIARGLSEGWMSTLAGSGRIRDYGPTVFFGALLNPVLVIGLYFLLPPDVGFLSVSVVFMLLNVVFHLIAVPRITARFLGISFLDMLRPSLLPLVAGLAVCSLSAAIGSYLSGELPRFWVTVFLVGATFGLWFLFSFRRLMRLTET